MFMVKKIGTAGKEDTTKNIFAAKEAGLTTESRVNDGSGSHWALSASVRMSMNKAALSSDKEENL